MYVWCMCHMYVWILNKCVLLCFILFNEKLNHSCIQIFLQNFYIFLNLALLNLTTKIQQCTLKLFKAEQLHFLYKLQNFSLGTYADSSKYQLGNLLSFPSYTIEQRSKPLLHTLLSYRSICNSVQSIHNVYEKKLVYCQSSFQI